MINSFTREYAFLSNFYFCDVDYEGITYNCAETAFQCAKVSNYNIKLEHADMNPSQARRWGRTVVGLPYDWDKIKDDIMYNIVESKFNCNPYLAKKLIATGNEELIEGNNWHDTYWGVCNGIGQNKLGNILMNIRNKIKET